MKIKEVKLMIDKSWIKIPVGVSLTIIRDQGVVWVSFKGVWYSLPTENVLFATVIAKFFKPKKGKNETKS